MTPYEIVIPLHPKDEEKLPFIVERIWRFTSPQQIHIILHPQAEVDVSGMKAVVLHDEQDVLPVDKEMFSGTNRSPAWIYQQFLKLFQDVTETNWFIGMDADLFFNAPYPVFSGSKPQIVTARNPNGRPRQYDRFARAMLGEAQRTCFQDFLSDATLYSKKIIGEILERAGCDVMEFVNKAARALHPKVVPGDANLYMYHVCDRHPNLYNIVNLRNEWGGKYLSETYTAEEIEDVLDKWAGDGRVHTISLHSWS